MRRLRSIPLTLLATAFLFLPVSPVLAGSFGLTQHGGRATAQAGAFVARADDPSAVTYNPAGIARLDGFQLFLGADAVDPSRKARAGATTFEADDSKELLPAAYLTYRLPGPGERFVLGLGIDSPWWSSVEWNDRRFPGRRVARETAIETLEIHPVLGVRLSDRWSIGGGLRYVTGDFRYGLDIEGGVGLERDDIRPFVLGVTGEGSDEDLSWDFGAQYTAPTWGVGAVYRHFISLESHDPVDLDIVEIGVPEASGFLLDIYDQTSASQVYELPKELVVGGWFAPVPTLRLEVDLAYADWTTSESVLFGDFPLGGTREPFPLAQQTRAWDDTLSIRLGAEIDLGRSWLLSGGLASEPSPVPGGSGDLGFPGGDAIVYSIGLSRRWAGATLDAGYSYWDYDDTDVRLRSAPRTLTSYGLESSEHAASVSIRWKF